MKIQCTCNKTDAYCNGVGINCHNPDHEAPLIRTDNTQVIINLQKENEKLRAVLTEIEQFSYSGSYLHSIAKMKQLATETLTGLSKSTDPRTDEYLELEAKYVRVCNAFEELLGTALIAQQVADREGVRLEWTELAGLSTSREGEK